MAVKLEEKNAKIIIAAISVVVALLVGVINWVLEKPETPFMDLSFFPKFHAILNSIVAVLLVLGLYFIKNKKIDQHKVVMFSAFLVSSVFLLSYVFYHTFALETKFGGDGAIKYFYLLLLISHIILAAVMMPFILMTFYYAWTENLDKHRKLAKRVWPFWFYVAVTGVVIYFMIAPYYKF
jgi:putative membrane protein